MAGGYFTNYPKHVICILANEFCERFSFYGMRAILVIYLWSAIGLSKSTATAIYHASLVVSYFTPLLGAIMADAWLGKCRTIIYVSILYCLGNILMTLTAIPFDGNYYIYGPVIALIMIALGTGGIKPCVSSFGGDQFKDNQKRQKDSFFSVFYMAINIGSLISTIITPTIRGGVFCYNTSCYALAFGIPAILMIVAIVFFIIGTRWYTHVPPTQSVITRLAGCIAKAAFRSCRCSRKNSSEKKEHWLDHAEPDYDRQFISDVKDVTRVIWIFLPLPVFWALYDQQGSRWTLQAAQMNGDLGNWIIGPDLIQVLNPLLIIIMVPLLESLFFPCLNKIGIPFRPLQRMGWGMILAASSFVIAAGLQAVIDKDIPAALGIGQTRVQFINTSPCSIGISSATDNDTSLAYQQISSFANTEYHELKAGNLALTVDWTQCGNISGQPLLQHFNLSFEQKKAYQVFLGNDLTPHQFEQTQLTPTDDIQSTVRFYNSLDVSFASINLTTAKGQEDAPRSLGPTPVRFVSKYEVIILVNFLVDVVFADNSTLRLETEVHSQNGAVYTIILRNRTTPISSSSSSSSASQQQDLNLEIVQLVDIPPWSTNILLQIPQYVVISFGECLFSITGLAFAYTQAPVSMKSFLSAIWLVTDAIGNVIVIIVAESGSSLQQVYEFVLFAGLMFFTTFIFMLMALSYQYVDLRVSDQQQTQSTTEEEDGADREDVSKEKIEDRDHASSKAAEAGEMEVRARSKPDVTHL